MSGHLCLYSTLNLPTAVISSSSFLNWADTQNGIDLLVVVCLFVFSISHHQEHLWVTGSSVIAFGPCLYRALVRLAFSWVTVFSPWAQNSPLHFSVFLTKTRCSAHGRASINPCLVDWAVESSQLSSGDLGNKDNKREWKLLNSAQMSFLLLISLVL